MARNTILNENVGNILEEIFLILTETEKEVIYHRFSIDNTSKKTLESIGKMFNVTRERIRQIENIALLKLRRHMPSSKLMDISKIAREVLLENGKIMKADNLVKETLLRIGESEFIDASVVTLALSVDMDISKNEKSGNIDPSWRFDSIPLFRIRAVTDTIEKLFNELGDISSFEDIYQGLQKYKLFEDSEDSRQFITSCMNIDNRIAKTETGWGLMKWRNVNPKSIRDKAIIVFKKFKYPMHFRDVSKKISEVDINKKNVTTQAVHNELIRYDDFVLIGRGLYALKEWGYTPGTVSAILTKILKEKGPLSKKEIIREIQKQREVQIGTISLNLQKNECFVRVGRAIYDYKAPAKKDSKK